jgi:hypothetical protein
MMKHKIMDVPIKCRYGSNNRTAKKFREVVVTKACVVKL